MAQRSMLGIIFRKAKIVPGSVVAKGGVISQKRSMGNIPLWYAARYGKEKVVKRLLARDDIDPNERNIRAETALWWAALNGHEGVVKLLLGRADTDPNLGDPYGRTPLWMAVADRHEGVVKILLERDDIWLNCLDDYNRTLLDLATQNGDEGIVQLLLHCKAVGNYNSKWYGQAPLSIAGRHGYFELTSLLQTQVEGAHKTTEACRGMALVTIVQYRANG